MLFERWTKEGLKKKTDLCGLYSGPLFLLGGHPSLRSEPPELFQQPGVVTLAMNNVAALIKPNLWVGADRPNCFTRSILLDPTILKLGRAEYANLPVGDQRWAEQPNTYFYNLQTTFQPRDFLVGEVFWWKNTFMISLQLAAILGFDDIYLCGTGFDIKPDAQYAYESTLDADQVDYTQQTFLMAVQQFITALPHMVGKRIRSCTPNSPINKHVGFIPLAEAVAEVSGRFPEPDTRNVVHASVNKAEEEKPKLSYADTYEIVYKLDPGYGDRSPERVLSPRISQWATENQLQKAAVLMCGRGYAVQALRQAGVDARGIDIAAPALPEIADYVARADVLQQPIPADCGVVCIDGLEHLGTPDLGALRDRLEGRPCFFQVSTAPDQTGPRLLGQQLHRTIMDPAGWQKLFEQNWSCLTSEFDGQGVMLYVGAPKA